MTNPSHTWESMLDALQHPVSTFTSSPIAAALITLPLLYTLTRIFHTSAPMIHHANTTLTLPLKSGSSTTFANVLRPLVPPYRPTPLLPGGNLQTIATTFKHTHIPIHYKRHIFQATDPTYTGQFAVDFVTPPSTTSDPALPPRTTYFSPSEWTVFTTSDPTNTTPLLILLHGLSGGSHELYLRAFLEPLVRSESRPQGGGWDACVVISRGCANTEITSSILYNARATWDVRQTVKWAREIWPNRPLFAAGFSLGGNILVNYLGEEGEGCELSGAVVVSAIWNNEVADRALRRTWWKREVYCRTLGGNMKRLFEKHVDKIRENERIDVEKVRGCTYLYEFDRYVQGPSWGYPSEGAYYRDASSVDAMLGVRVPLLAIHALDDPVICDEVLPYQEIEVTPYVVLVTTKGGGHLGWFERGGGRWFVKPVSWPSSHYRDIPLTIEKAVNFLNKMVNDVQLDKVSKTELGALEGHVERDARGPLKPWFDPTRRKLHISGQ